jgi:virginiamycin B lyase
MCAMSSRVSSRQGRAGGLLVGLALMLAFGVSVAHADLTGTIAEYSAGLQAGALPEAIAPGADGNMWFVDQACRTGASHPCAIGRITMSGQISEFPLTADGDVPVDIAMGSDGNMWFTENQGAGAIGRITPAGQITLFTQTQGLASGAFPTDIALGPDGNMWFTDNGRNGAAVGKVTPAGQIQEFAAPAAVSAGIAVGPNGNMWFAGSQVGQVTPAGQVSSVSSTPISAGELVPGPDGNLWLANTTIDNVTPVGHVNAFTLNANTVLVGIAPGSDGNVWFADDGCQQPNVACQIGAITPSGQVTEYEMNPNGASLPQMPQYLAPGADGDVWFTDDGTTPAIGTIGTGAATAAVAPVVSGSNQAGSPETCVGRWPGWAGVSPSATLLGFDRYQWLRDGAPIAGQTGPNYIPSASDVGHQLACSTTATYPKPYFVTTSATSSAITVLQATSGGGGASPGGGGGSRSGATAASASLARVSTLGPTLSMNVRCQGTVDQSCTGSATVTLHERIEGQTVVAVTAGQHPKPKPVTKTVRVGSGSFSIPAGKTGKIKIGLNASGRRLLAEFYSIRTTLQLAGTSIPKRTVTFAYARITSPVQWAYTFTPSTTTLRSLTVSALPHNAHVGVRCSGPSCPFASAAPKPHGSQDNLSKLLSRAPLDPGVRLYITITAPDHIGEVLLFTIKHGAPPVKSQLCESPGTRSPQPCR